MRVRPIHQMQRQSKSRRNWLGDWALPSATLSVTLLCALLAAGASAQDRMQRLRQPPEPRTSSLPPTQPTTLPTAPPAAASPATAQPATLAPIDAKTNTSAPTTKPHRAQVSFAAGSLTVRANDSSLHQILRAISQQTGMTISGGVVDQRVFGTYGPTDASTILATLLDGTGVNMLIREGDSHVPVELVLTPRGGAPSPPSIAPQDDEVDADGTPPPGSTTQQAPAQRSPTDRQGPAQQQVAAPASASGPPSVPLPFNNVLGNPNNNTPTASQIPTTNSVPLDSVPTPSTTVQTQQGIVDTPNPPPPGSTSPTADSIYQQLLQLQKAKAAAATGNTTTPPPAPTPPPQ